MKRSFLVVFIAFLAAGAAFAAPLGTNARAVIPAHVQQIISIDYRTLRNSESGMALRNRIMPDNLKQFEQALKKMGVDPERQVGQLTFVAYRSTRGGVNTFGVAQGEFSPRQFIARMKVKSVRPEKYRFTYVYPTGTGMVMTFLDDNTMLFGPVNAVHNALDARDGEAQSLNSNSQMSEMISDTDSGALWSVLDQLGTQNMLHSSLGDAASLADYDVVKKRLLGSRYTVDFSNGVDFRLNVVTSDTMTAATMASLIKAGMMFKRMNASSVEKSAMEGMTVDSDSGRIVVRFQADDHKFQSLLGSQMFAQTLR